MRGFLVTKYMSKYTKQPSIEQRIITGIGRALWALVSLPFKKKKSGDIATRWKEVQDLLAKDDAHAWAMAIVKADSILDSVLQKRVSGETMGERLKNMEGKLDRGTLQSAWDAHKIRNQIAHGDGDINRTQAQEVIGKVRMVLNKFDEL